MEIKTFKHYEELPSDVRMEIINEMQPIERVIFTGCSKTSQNEAKKSKNYMYELRLHLPPRPNHKLAICVLHKKHERGIREGYEIVFKEEEEEEEEGGVGHKYIIYQHQYPSQELYRVELDKSVDLVEYAKEHFKSLLQMYQNTIKTLYISETDNYDYGIRNLKKLENLTLKKNSDVLPFLAIIRKPLKTLCFEETENHEMINASEQIYQVQHQLNSYSLKINYEQFKRLNAKDICVSTWELTPHDVYDFIESWKTGTIRASFRHCCWNIGLSQFDKDELFLLLGEEYNGTKEHILHIEHNTEASRIATLVYWRITNSFMFTV